MASKMPVAIDRNNKSITITVAEDYGYEKPLRCKFCDALVEFVNGYTRNVGDEIIPVKPFFRLKRGGDGHQDSCCYNVKGQIKIIARESEGNVFAALDADKFELRLLAVKKAIEELQELAKEKQYSDLERDSDSAQKKYVAAKKRLGAYINSAKRVLKVRTFCEKNSDIEDVLELLFEDVRIPWRDFYYEDEDYFRCFSNVDKATVQVPIAVQGVVKSNQVVNGRNSKLAVINLSGPYRPTDQQDSLDAACISIWSPDLEAFKPYTKGIEILAFGMWMSQKRENPNRKQNSKIKMYRNHELKLWPITRSQLCKLSG